MGGRRGTLLALVAMAAGSTSCAAAQPADEDWRQLTPEVEASFTFARSRFERLVERIDDNPLAAAAYPSATRDGVYQLVGAEEWDAGFYPLALWLLYEMTG